MNRQNSVTRTRPRSGGCGCGGSGGCGGGCNGSSGNASCGCQEGLVAQPHFFAGQLLTDEDLQALTDYTITKHRLHNRFITGSGVSCGLMVSCHPCGGGKVQVHPGYAVDCCGNDILVPCPVELDINSMVRELRFKRAGQDCGDPCKDYDPKAAERENDRYRHTDCREPADRYCLYLHYCEIPSDPVTPYQQDDCSDQCQPTRIHEGFRFELRCPQDEHDPPSFLDHIRCCVGELEEAESAAGKFERSQAQLQKANYAIRAYDTKQWAYFSNQDAQIIADAHDALAADAPLYFSQPGSGKRVTKATAEESQLTEKIVRQSLDNVQNLGSAIARWELLGNEQKDNFAGKHTELTKNIEQSRVLINKVSPVIAQKSPLYLSAPIERQAAITLLDNTKRYIDPQLDMGQRQTYQATLYSHNVLSDPAMNTQLNSTLGDFKNWLLRRMYRCPPTTECGLIAEVTAVMIPVGDTVDEASVTAADILVRAFVRYLLDCICTALLPPCPTCEDPGVKLACLEVRDCDVDNICNLERTFLLTEHNLRYWLPVLHGFGEMLERLCCEWSTIFDCPTLEPRNPNDQKSDASPDQYQMMQQNAYFGSGYQYSQALATQPAYPNILRLTGLSDARVRSTLNLGNSMSTLMLRQPQITGLLQAHDQIDAGTELGSQGLVRVFEHPQAKAALQVAAANQMKEVEARIENITTEGLKMAEEMQERISSRVRELEEDVSKRLTVNRLSSTKVIKDLQAALEAQKKQNDSLMARLEKLEKGAEK